jgi:hypothetical protein
MQDPEEWQVCGDFKIQVFLDSISRSRSLFWCWHNTSFMSGTNTTLNRDELDKVHRSMPPSMRMSLQWHAGEGGTLPVHAASAATRKSTSDLLLETEELSAAPSAIMDTDGECSSVNFAMGYGR